MVNRPRDGRPDVTEKGEGMRSTHRMRPNAAYAVLFFVLVLPSLIFAQAPADESRKGGIEYSFSLTPTLQFSAPVDGGGSMSVFRNFFSADATVPVNQSFRLGFGLSYDFQNYNFSGLERFIVPEPWNRIHRLGVDASFFYKMSERWTLFVGPTAEFSAEEGADWGTALNYGGIFSLSYSTGPGLTIGAGLGVFSGLAQSSAFPYLVISWKITDRLRLSNPFQAGPAGPAGLELAYTLDKNWEIATGGAYRSFRFRLDENGPIPNGIGEESLYPAYVRLSRAVGPGMTISLYGGAALAGKLTLQNKRGHDIDEANYDAAPLIALSISGKF